MMYEYSATLVRVIDGDTVQMDVDLGFNITIREHFRLEAINAPEVSTQDGRDAKKFLSERLSISQKLVIRTSKPLRQEKYGRWLASIYEINSEKSINQILVDLGYAKPYIP
jgi:micrococcal nuclease